MGLLERKKGEQAQTILVTPPGCTPQVAHWAVFLGSYRPSDTPHDFLLEVVSPTPLLCLSGGLGKQQARPEGLWWLWSSALLTCEASRWGCVLNLVAEKELCWNGS